MSKPGDSQAVVQQTAEAVARYADDVGRLKHAIGQVIRSSSSVAANYRSACRGKSKADFIAKLGTVEEEADETGFWLEMLRDIAQRRRLKLEAQASQELTRLLDEANQLVAITVASRKTARGNND